MSPFDHDLGLGEPLLGQLRDALLDLVKQSGAPGIAEVRFVVTELPGRLVRLPIGERVGDDRR
jgi:hypothetical protein